MNKIVKLLLILTTLVPLGFSQSVVFGTGVNAGGVNTQVGTTYTVLASDQGKLVTFSNASPVAVTLAQATGQFGSGWYMDTCNYGAGLVTITPTTSTINGASTFTQPQNTCDWVFSDGTNYKASVHVASSGGGSTLNKQDVGSGTVGNASDQTVYTYSMPGSSLASGKCLIITSWVQRTAGSDALALKISFGATTLTFATTSSGIAKAEAKVCNNNASTTAQWAAGQMISGATTSVTSANPAENTSGSITLKITNNVTAATTWQGLGWTVVAEP
jgi:hypothetical protein